MKSHINPDVNRDDSSFPISKYYKIFLILHLMFASFMLTGCWDRREINDTALVLGAAIDKGKGKNIRLTVQVLIPKSLSTGAGGTGGTVSRVLVRSATGENFMDASSKVQTKIPRKIFWGHCKAYVFGRKLAQAGGIREQIDFLLRHPEPRERAYLFVSEDEAYKIMKFRPILEQYTGEALRKIAEMHIGMTTTVKEFEQMLTGDAGGALLPMINVLHVQHEKKEMMLEPVSGTAIFKKDKMVGQISPKLTRGLMWLRNEIEVTAVTVNPKKGETISLDPIRETTKLIPSIKNGKWNMLVKIKSEGTIVQNASHYDIMSPTITKMVEKELENDIKQRINLSLKLVKNKMNVDAFGFADAFHRKYPKEWENVQDHWDKVLPHVNVKIAISTIVRRPGLSTTPAGLKEKEVEKK